MSIYRKPHSPFYWYDLRLAGKRHRGSTKQTSKAKAQQFEAQVIQQLMAGQHSTIHNRPPYLADFAPKFLAFVFDQSRLRPKTKDYYRSGWRLLSTQQVAGMRLDAITNSITAGVVVAGGGSSVNCALRTLRRILSLAFEWNVLQRVPRIDLAKERQRERMISPAEEVMILVKASPTIRDVVTLIMDTGMRPSEAASLRWCDVDFLTGVILIVNGKTANARRHLPMTQRVRETLTQRVSASAWVFPSSRHAGRPMKGGTISTMLSALKREIGLPEDLVLYSARHTFATDFLQATGNVAKLKKVMGHSSLGTTQRYLHPETGDLGSVMDERNANRGLVGSQIGHTSQVIQ